MPRRLGAILTVWAALSSSLLASACAGELDGQGAWEPPEYFAQECYADVGGLRVCYLEAGTENEQTLVFVHGWSGNVHNWWDQYEHFSRDHHVLVFDLPGHGKSERSAAIEYSTDLWVETVVTLMDLRKIDHAILVGNSAGGNIAARVAIKHPERVERLVLSDATGSGKDGILAWVKHSITPRKLHRAGLTTGEHFPGEDPKSRARAEMIRSYVGTEEERAYLEALTESVPSLFERIPAEDLRQIRVPTLLIWGADDPVLPKRSIKYFEQHIADSQTYWVHGGGHNPNTEAPEVFNCVLRSFVEERESPACDAEPMRRVSAQRPR